VSAWLGRCVLAVVAAALIAPGAASAQTSATVTRVLDGDTVEAVTLASPTITVQLIGIDAPEFRSDGRAECGAAAATEALRALVEGRIVTLVSDPTQGATDPYNRTLAYIDVAGVDAGQQQLLAGRAEVLVTPTLFQRYPRYAAAQASAQAGAAGVWGECGGRFHDVIAAESATRPSRAESAERFVRRYYFLLNQRRFSDAWGVYSATARRKLGGYAGWRNGFRRSLGTKVNELSVSLANGKASVRVAIRSRDKDACNGHEVRQFFRGRWVLSRRAGWWVASSLTMRKVGGGKVRLSKSDCAPKPRPTPAQSPSTGGGGGGGSGCHPSYTPCVPNDRDYDCPELNGPYTVSGPDEYRLDGDNDGVGCE
jgi:micrococcal nuclease